MSDGVEQQEQDGNGAGEEPDERVQPGRVVLRGVRVLVLDDLSGGDRDVLDDAGLLDANPPEAWLAVAARSGTYDGAIKSYSGQSGSPDCVPGKYKALPRGSWFVSPLVIEPPLG